MKTWLAVLAALLFLTSSCTWQTRPGPAVAEGQPANTEDLRLRTLLIERHCGGTLKGWGTAVLLGNQRAVTAAHVATFDSDLETGCGLVATNSHGVMSAVIVARTDEDLDFAWLTLPQLPATAIETRVRAPLWGERVACVGYSFQPTQSMSQMLSLTHGTVATTPAEGMPHEFYRITAPMLPGHSGGGCWGSDGALLLIVQAGHFDYEGYVYGRRPQ